MSSSVAESVSAEKFKSLQGRITKLEEELRLQGALSTQPHIEREDAVSMVIFSGDLDRLLASFVIATSEAACGAKVSMFFTFWAAAAMKKEGARAKGKSFVERLFSFLLPVGFNKQKLSKIDLGGVGRQILLREMKKKGVPSLAELIDIAADLGIQFHFCELATSLMGIKEEELIDYPHKQICGYATFAEESAKSRSSLFI